MSGITMEEILAEMRRIEAESAKSDEGSVTIRELVESTGKCKEVIRRQLRALIQEGKVKPVQKMHRFMDGRHVRVPAYTVMPLPPETPKTKRKRS